MSEPLTPAEAIAIAGSIARDPEVDATARMEALEVIERWREHLAPAAPPDELAQRRRRRRTG